MDLLTNHRLAKWLMTKPKNLKTMFKSSNGRTNDDVPLPERLPMPLLLKIQTLETLKKNMNPQLRRALLQLRLRLFLLKEHGEQDECCSKKL
jgi:hypothetical protein